MCSRCLEQILNQFKDQLFHQAPKEEPRFTELEIKQLKERQELVEKQEQERAQVGLDEHQKEGWANRVDNSSGTESEAMMVAAILSLQRQIDELKL